MSWKSILISWLATLFLVSCVQSQPTEIATNLENEFEYSENLLQKTQQVLSSPTGQMLVQVSKELLSRSFGNGQALSLNFTNFLIILLLKALIIMAGFIGAGSWTMFARGRDIRGELWLTESEKNLYMGFLAAEMGDFGCLSKAACASPGLAKQYVHAARALLNGIEKFNGQPVESYEDYLDLIKVTEEASMRGYKGVACEMYSCRI